MKLKNVLLMAGCATILTLGASNVLAQGQEGGPGGGPGGPGGGFGGPGGGPGRMNFDPAQARKFMMDMYREQLNVKDDAEWKELEARIGKVMEARREVGFGGGFGMMRPRRNNGDSNGGNRPQNPFATTNAALDALQKAVDAKASSAELKTKLDAYRAEMKAREEKLAKAQEDLKKLLTPEQEAVAVLGGLLK